MFSFLLLQISEYREIFSLFDKDCDACISSSEIGPVLRSVGLNPTEEEISELVHYYDKNSTYARKYYELAYFILYLKVK